MLLIKRITTASGCFILFFIITYIALCMIGDAVAGGIAGLQDPENAAAASELTGAIFVQNNIFYIIGTSFVFSMVSACWLSFFGIFPWCRVKSQES